MLYFFLRYRTYPSSEDRRFKADEGKIAHFASTLLLHILVKPIHFRFSPDVFIVATKIDLGPSLLLPQAYLKHLKKQQKELNSLKKKHAKVHCAEHVCICVCDFVCWFVFTFNFQMKISSYSV